MIIDLTKPVEKSEDFHFLKTILSALVGQRWLRAGPSYGGELVLHLGEPVPYPHPKLAGGTKGEWILGTRASHWQLLLRDEGLLIVSGEPATEGSAAAVSDREIEKRAESLAGKPVAWAYPFPVPLWKSPGYGIGLVLRLIDHSRLVVLPSEEPDEEGEEPLPDWELFTPYHRYLRVGPGFSWSYSPSDVPAASA